MSPPTVGAPILMPRFPRVSGDEPSPKPIDAIRSLFSPRERG